jgi:hypothetical protein
VLTTPNGENLRNTLPKFSDQADLTQFERNQFKPDADGHLFLFHEHELRDIAGRAGLQVASFEFFQTHLAYVVARVVPRLLRSNNTGAHLLRSVDAMALRLPVVRRKFALQMAARLMKGQPIDRDA